VSAARDAGVVLERTVSGGDTCVGRVVGRCEMNSWTYDIFRPFGGGVRSWLS